MKNDLGANLNDSKLTISGNASSEQWNLLVSSLSGCALHTYEWARFSIAPQNQKKLFFEMADNAGDTIAITHGNLNTTRFFGIPIQKSLSFGCLPAAVNNRSRDETIRRVVRYAQQSNMVGIVFNSFGTPGECPVFDEFVFQKKKRWEFVLDINRPIDALWKKLHSKKRNLIRKAQKAGIEVNQGKDISDLLLYRQLALDTWKRKTSQGIQFPMVAEASYFEKMHKSLIDKGLAKLYIASRNGKAVAGAVFVCFGQSAYYMLSSANQDGLRKSGPDLILWSAITDFHNEGFTEFNFGGVSEDELAGQPLEKSGLFHFKNRFTPEIVPAYKATLIFQPRRKAIVEKMQSTKKGLFNLIRR
jgi:hypothetical protein